MKDIVAQKMLRYPDRGSIIAFLFEEGHQALCRMEKRLMQAISFGEDPILIAAREQVATIQTSRMLQCLAHACQIVDLFGMRGGGKCLLKLLDIEGEMYIWGRVPLEALSVGGHEVVSGGKGLAQVIEQLAQVGMGLRFLRIGPEEKGQVRAILGSAAMQHQVSQQRLDTRDSDCQGGLTRQQQEVTEQRHVKGGDHQ